MGVLHIVRKWLFLSFFFFFYGDVRFVLFDDDNPGGWTRQEMRVDFIATEYAIHKCWPWKKVRFLCVLSCTGPGSNSGSLKIFVSSPKRPAWLWGRPVFWSVGGGGGSSPGIKCLGCEVDHSHLVPRLRISGDIPSFPLYAFMVWTGTTSPFIARKLFGTAIEHIANVCRDEPKSTRGWGGGVLLNNTGLGRVKLGVTVCQSYLFLWQSKDVLSFVNYRSLIFW
jgi:hypothetical protein